MGSRTAVATDGRTSRLRNHADRTYSVPGSTGISVASVADVVSAAAAISTERAPECAWPRTSRGGLGPDVRCQPSGTPSPFASSSNPVFGSRFGCPPAILNENPPPLPETSGSARPPS